MSPAHVHQCPRCQCRFLDEPELEDHLSRDHGVEHVGHIFEHTREDPSHH